MRSIREHMSIFFAYLAYRVAPKDVRNVHLTALWHLQGVAAQIQLGRTWGVGTLRWSRTEEGEQKALLMENAMLQTAKEWRASSEWSETTMRIASLGNTGCPEPQDPNTVEPELRRKPDQSGDDNV